MESVLITGATGFTGLHLANFLNKQGFNVINNSSDLLCIDQLEKTILNQDFSYVIHLAAISYVGAKSPIKFYEVNTIGTENLLNVLTKYHKNIKKVIIASSANVYGNVCQQGELISEDFCPNPLNYYGTSKLAMEKLTQNFFSKLPILITRPFNYTGCGQSSSFIVPKLVEHYQQKKSVIELGNINVSRDFSDVEDVVKSYYKLLVCDSDSEIINICSSHSISLKTIIKTLEELSGFRPEIQINPDFVRKDEIKVLKGDNIKLFELTGFKPSKNGITRVLEQMYKAS